MKRLGRRSVLAGGLAACLPLPATAQTPSVYITENGEVIGPFDEAALRRKIPSQAVAAQTLVWHDGMADWAMASTVPALAAFIATLPAETPLNLTTFLPGTWLSHNAQHEFRNDKVTVLVREQMVLSADGRLEGVIYWEKLSTQHTQVEPARQLPGGGMTTPVWKSEDTSLKIQLSMSGTYTAQLTQDGWIYMVTKGELAETFKQDPNAPKGAPKPPPEKFESVRYFEILNPDHLRSSNFEDFMRQ